MRLPTMLDAWIIEELKRLEKKRREVERTQLELPIPEYIDEEEEEEPQRGVVEIQL